MFGGSYIKLRIKHRAAKTFPRDDLYLNEEYKCALRQTLKRKCQPLFAEHPLTYTGFQEIALTRFVSKTNFLQLSFSLWTITMPNVKLTEIPVELQSHILTKLYDYLLFLENTPLACTVETVAGCLECFPDDLLHAAQASSTLSEAVAIALGSKAKFLSFRRSMRLAEWIAVLAKNVKAVSLTGARILGYREQGCKGITCQCNDFCYKYLLNALKALHTNDLALVVLNLEELVNPNPERIGELVEHMVKAIHRSKSSLKEIAVYVNRATALTMPRVSLPNLKVAQISSEELRRGADVVSSNVSNRAKIFGEVLLGINGSANNLQDLRLCNMNKPPVLARQVWQTLFPNVTKLFVSGGKNSKHGEIAKFIANFRNIEVLSWFTRVMCPEDVYTILTGCPLIRGLDICIKDRNILLGDINLVQNSSKLRELFVSFQGKLSNLKIHAFLSCAQIRYLGENCHNLRVLEMEIDSTNVEALCLLLGTHCRKLRTMRLVYSKEANDGLGSNGWQAYAKGLCSASNDLCEISLRSDVKGAMLESAADELELAICDVLEFLGDRATSIIFHVPINTENPFVVLEVLWKTLKAAKTYCRSVEVLSLEFIKDHAVGNYHVEKAQENDLLDAFVSVCRFHAEYILCSENKVSIGEIDTLWEGQWDDEDEDEEAVAEELLNVPAGFADLLNDVMEA